MAGSRCAAHAPQKIAGEVFEPNGKHRELLNKYSSEPSEIKHLKVTKPHGKRPVGQKLPTPPGVPKTVDGTKVYPHFQ